jgi:hypothetical protein
MATILEEQRRRLARHERPLFERVQDWLSRLEIGGGVNLFHFGLFVALALGVIVFYTGTQFYGLRDAEAMNLGQLGRNLTVGRGYVTRSIRPADVYYLNALGRPTLGGERIALPELWTPPVYPLVLSVAFRVTGAPGRGNADQPLGNSDRLMMITGWVFFMAGLGLMYWLSHELFDKRVAVLGVFLYLFCNPLLDHAMAGLPTGFLSVLLLLMVTAFFKARQWQEQNQPKWWVLGAVATSAVALGVGILTEYVFAALVVPWLLYVGRTFRGQSLTSLTLGLALLLAVLAPWMIRNYRASGKFFGLAPGSLMEGTGRGTDHEIRVGQLQRTYAPTVPVALRAIGRKALINLREMYENTIKDIGGNYSIVFFLVALLHRFRREEVLRMQRLLFLGVIGCVLWLSIAGAPKRNPLTFFAPVMIIYAAAFFFVMFERLQFRTRASRAGMVLLFAGVNMVPFGLAILPPRDTFPYPPYNAVVTGQLREIFRSTELLASDLPWAVAWYADRSAVWAPLEERDYMKLHDEVRNIEGIYLTQATLLGQSGLEMFGGYQQFWWRMFLAPPAKNFPLRIPAPMTPDGQQLLISNRQP